jgi:DNA-binding transcriptional regulator YdaS (Cro superfamily)
MQYAWDEVAHNAYQFMKLRAFLDTMPRGGIAGFALRLGISPIYLSQLAAEQDGRVPSPELCVAIEKSSQGQVMRWDMRPSDWHRIWPELIGTSGAPNVPLEATHG